MLIHKKILGPVLIITSLNDHVDRKAFDNRLFTLRFLTIDDIVAAITTIEDPVIFKIDISRVFRNLRVDPRDALKFGCKIFAYIDDFVGVCTKSQGQHYFRILYDLITDLGLPVNPDKVNPPAVELTCLGISINIDNSTLAIDKQKLDTFYEECCNTLKHKYLSRQKFQSLLGKLLYIHSILQVKSSVITRQWFRWFRLAKLKILV